MKKFLPALMLLAVATFTFAFRPAPAHKTLTDVVYVFNGVSWEGPNPSAPATLCPTAGSEICAIVFDDGIDETEAEAAAEEFFADQDNDLSSFTSGSTLPSDSRIHLYTKP